MPKKATRKPPKRQPVKHEIINGPHGSKIRINPATYKKKNPGPKTTAARAEWLRKKFGEGILKTKAVDKFGKAATKEVTDAFLGKKHIIKDSRTGGPLKNKKGKIVRQRSGGLWALRKAHVIKAPKGEKARKALEKTYQVVGDKVIIRKLNALAAERVKIHSDGSVSRFIGDAELLSVPIPAHATKSLEAFEHWTKVIQGKKGRAGSFRVEYRYGFGIEYFDLVEAFEDIESYAGGENGAVSVAFIF